MLNAEVPIRRKLAEACKRNTCPVRTGAERRLENLRSEVCARVRQAWRGAATRGGQVRVRECEAMQR